MKRDIITGLDIGSFKVCATIAEIRHNDKLDILGTATSPSSGMWRGTISNLSGVTDSIARAIEGAEERSRLRTKSPIKAHNIIANVGGPSVRSGIYEGAIFLSNIPRVVTRRDITKVIDIAKNLSISLGEDPIHLIPLSYTLDNQEEIENPLGLYGVKLKVKLYIITCAANLIRNISKAVNNAGYEAKDIVYTGIANSSVLTRDDRSDGVAIIDIGSQITELAIFSRDKIRYRSSLSAGGLDVTEEISSHFKIPKRAAEDLKLRYGTIYEQDLNKDERLSLEVDQRRVSVDRSSMNYLIHSKIKDIFSLLKKELKKSGFENKLAAGIVMSGSPLAMSGVVETAEKEFSLPVRMASSNPAHSTSLGLASYAFNKFAGPDSRAFRKEGLFEKTFLRLKEILTDYF